MPDKTEGLKTTMETPRAVSRRKFIKGVVAGGAAVSSATYLFRASTFTSAAGAGDRLITLNVNGQLRRVDVMKQETLARTLRYKAGAHRHQDRLRPGRMRRLHRAYRRCAALFLLDPDAHRTQ